MDAKGWVELVQAHEDELREACQEAYQESVYASTYHTVQIDEDGDITINEYSNSTDISMDVWEGRAIVVASFGPYDPTDGLSHEEEVEYIAQNAASDDAMDAFRTYCEERGIDPEITVLREYDYAWYLRVLDDTRVDAIASAEYDWLYGGLYATLESLREEKAYQEAL